jgi:hypothetical protein
MPLGTTKCTTMADYSDWKFAPNPSSSNEFVQEVQGKLSRLFPRYPFVVQVNYLGADPSQYEFTIAEKGYLDSPTHRSVTYGYRRTVEEKVRELADLHLQVEKFDTELWAPFVRYDIMKVLR